MGRPPPLVVKVERSGTVESTHLIDVAVVDAKGSLVAGAGDPERLVAFRSSAKPLQASVCLELGWAPSSQAGLAIACASHDGEAAHRAAVVQVLAEGGIDRDRLACPPAWPVRPADIASSGTPDAISHNCSGKHAAFLATCAVQGWPLAEYRDPSHPLQRAILSTLSTAMRETPSSILVDGCGAPTPAGTLAGFARAFLATLGSEAARAMLAHPFLIGGTDRLDSALLELGIVTKAGAEGLSCAIVTLDGEPRSVAMKVRDGAARARGPALTHILESLAPGCTTGLARSLRHPPTLGDGVPVGATMASGRLS